MGEPETWEEGFRPDRGPWKVTVWTRKAGRVVVLQSDDFHHDVALEISGDFGRWEDRMAYAEWLANKLNAPTVSGGT